MLTLAPSCWLVAAGVVGADSVVVVVVGDVAVGVRGAGEVALVPVGVVFTLGVVGAVMVCDAGLVRVDSVAVVGVAAADTVALALLEAGGLRVRALGSSATPSATAAAPRAIPAMSSRRGDRIPWP
jgi:hypothetical protein